MYGILRANEEDNRRKTSPLWKITLVAIGIFALVLLGSLTTKKWNSEDSLIKSMNIEKKSTTRHGDAVSALARESNMDVIKAVGLVEEGRVKSKAAELEAEGDEILPADDVFSGTNGAMNPMQSITGSAWALSPNFCSGSLTHWQIGNSGGSRIKRVVGYFLGNGNLGGLYVLHENNQHHFLGHRTPDTGYSVSYKMTGNQGISGVAFETVGHYLTGFTLMWDDDKTGDIAKYAKIAFGRDGASFKSTNSWATQAHVCADAHGIKRLGFWFE